MAAGDLNMFPVGKQKGIEVPGEAGSRGCPGWTRTLPLGKSHLRVAVLSIHLVGSVDRVTPNSPKSRPSSETLVSLGLTPKGRPKG